MMDVIMNLRIILIYKQNLRMIYMPATATACFLAEYNHHHEYTYGRYNLATASHNKTT